VSMKEKIFAFFCSLLFLAASSKGQTIDGVLYTNFNNYYKWRGGAFDSTLLIPQIAASIGRRPGALRYSTADSSVYSWTGTQWRKVGDGASVPTLQQVTTAGNSIYYDDEYINFYNEDSTNLIGFIRNGGSDLIFKSGIGSTDFTTFRDNVIENYTNNQQHVIDLPDSSGYITQRVLINGTTYDASNKGTVNLGNTDTATVVKAYVTNAEAVTITKGQVVYIFGASGDRAAVKLAKNTSDTFSSKTLGIVRADIAAGQAGWVTTQGQVSGINLGAYTAGDILWLDSVPGGFTKVKPVAPYHSVFVGVVERANVGNGLIYVKPQNGQELGELHDVKLTSPTNNQVLSYTAATGIWENKTVSASIFPYTAQTTTYTAGADDYVIHCTSGTFTVSLPTAVGITGKVYIIKNSGSGLITIDPNGSQTIDGATTYVMGGAESVQVISTGSNWITL